MQKMIKQSVLDECKWYGIDVGSSVVSYCEDCGCQRVHTCVDREWVDGGWLFVFLCDFCRFGGC
ncbi:MAG: hypothetical protein JSW60_07380 [Thermoplasmatales archaeon]|nr:MAG: hypothetical protein JSW60_07380 [Thermoplasmatales archaeon]